MADKKENTANNSNNRVAVNKETDFVDTQHGEIPNYYNHNKSYSVSNFTSIYINTVPNRALFDDMTPCTLAEYLSTQYHI
jgi:hypothetical protein